MNIKKGITLIREKAKSRKTTISSTEDGFEIQEKERKDKTQILGNLQINKVKSIHLSPATMGLILAILISGIVGLLWLNKMLPWQ